MEQNNWIGACLKCVSKHAKQQLDIEFCCRFMNIENFENFSSAAQHTWTVDRRSHIGASPKSFKLANKRATCATGMGICFFHFFFFHLIHSQHWSRKIKWHIQSSGEFFRLKFRVQFEMFRKYVRMPMKCRIILLVNQISPIVLNAVNHKCNSLGKAFALHLPEVSAAVVTFFCRA